MRGAGPVALTLLTVPVGCTGSVPRRSRPLALPAKAVMAVLLTLLCLACRTMTPRPMTVTVAIRLAAGLPHRELRLFPLGDVPFRPRQRGPNQSAVDRALVFRVGIFLRLSVRRLGCGCDGHVRSRPYRERLDVSRGNVGKRFVGDDAGVIDGTGAGVFEDFLEQGARLFAAWGRSLGLLVFVLGVTRRTPRLPNVVVDHGDDDMVGDAALARTVVVQNVTEPKPALLHELPRSGPFGWE